MTQPTSPPLDGRVLFVVTMLRPSGETGVHTHFNTFMEWARRNGVPVRLVTPFDVGTLVAYPFFGLSRVLRLFSGELFWRWYRYSRFVVVRRELLRCLTPGTPAVVYAQDPLSACAALAVRARGRPVEVVVATHINISEADELVGKGDIKEGGRLQRRIADQERSILTRVDRLIFPSRFVAAAIRDRTPGVAEVPSALVPNFVSEPTNGHDAPLTADLISIGTLERRKNHQYLLHVLARTKAMGHSYRLTLVGEGPLRGKLIALARALGISEQIDFAGYVPAAAALIRRHRLYVHAARMETLGIALIEALAAARPVCAAPVGGVPEVITDGVEGKFWDLEDPEGGARAVIAILSDEGLYARMSAAARARYEADFATEIVAPRLLQALGRGVRVTEPAGGRVSR